MASEALTAGKASPHGQRRLTQLPLWAGLTALAALVGLGLGSLGALLVQAPGVSPSSLWREPYLAGVLRFSLWQASLSTLVSLALAVPVAVALARRPRFVGRRLLLRAMELSLVVPSLIALFGLVAVHGRQGWAAPLWEALTGAPAGYLYGLSGIVLAHVFYNLPLAARLLLQELERAPAAHWRLAAQLGLQRQAIWRTLEWPALKRLLPRLAALIFTLCFTSFAIVMTLGGGPGSTTLEVALYQALKFDNDLALAALLALVQLTICLGLWALALSQGGAPSLVAGDDAMPLQGRWQRRDALGVSRFTDGCWLVALSLLLLPPLAAVVLAGLGGVTDLAAQSSLWPALGRSLVMAAGAGSLALMLGLALLAGRGWLAARGQRLTAGLMEGSGQLILVLPALVLGTGLFLLLRPRLGGGWQGYGLVVLVNGFMALPFVMQVLRGALLGLPVAQRRLADQLDIQGLARFRWLLWPRLRRPAALALAYAMTLSLGDFSVIALFGSPSAPTLPMLLYQQLGSYRWQTAAATALVLLATVAALFMCFAWLTRRLPRYPFACPPRPDFPQPPANDRPEP
ncbi:MULTISPECIES: thiamine/thiamine pyrophosphate ABC transporter permease [Halomonadaceae]|uniref:thiamine/thiamine pyrophosphate ABC transporter permease n=1 Tax=Halomonadaceae TaxID=28256 RepID=UPI001583E4B1|nr:MULTISPECIES: thiamine/thiamine pyrophosphate ABC transporter permease [Halomonas]MDI4637965.1 thiamine/thiamine pyrophosphate ABC transporter permease [Halomonas sp. BMC7]NUJ58968.1 thiamine/thiamine pyrophosphate ABC transporter, permease protein [Halomonas taeanensis]